MDYNELYKKTCSFLNNESNPERFELMNNYFVVSELAFALFNQKITANQWNEIMLAKQRRKNKRYRTDKKILCMMRIMNCEKPVIKNYKIVFGTMTLDDHNLNQKEDTYMRKISKWCKSHFAMTIVNKDFGAKTEREHYHFIGLTNRELINTGKKSKTGRTLYNLKIQNYELGFEPDLEIMNLEDTKEVRNYLLKLNNHSNKETTKSRTRTFYSPYIKENFNVKALEYSSLDKAEKVCKKTKKSDLRYT